MYIHTFTRIHTIDMNHFKRGRESACEKCAYTCTENLY